ncbi:hypothetical protein D3C84_920320 [compost metagenome]
MLLHQIIAWAHSPKRLLQHVLPTVLPNWQPCWDTPGFYYCWFAAEHCFYRFRIANRAKDKQRNSLKIVLFLRLFQERMKRFAHFIIADHAKRLYHLQLRLAVAMAQRPEEGGAYQGVTLKPFWNRFSRKAFPQFNLFFKRQMIMIADRGRLLPFCLDFS